MADNRYRAWPRVKEFIQDLEPGSIICDVGKNIYIISSSYETGSTQLNVKSLKPFDILFSGMSAQTIKN